MTANADVVKLPAKDSALIDYFIKAGEFKSKNEFIIYAVKKAVNEVVLKELEEKSSTAPPMIEKDIDKLLSEIKDIRKTMGRVCPPRILIQTSNFGYLFEFVSVHI